MNQNSVTIVMYHYVRDLKKSAYPEIKGLETDLFIEQLEYFSRHYNFIKVTDLLDWANLPPRAALLTFDDGYIDHYQTVFRALKKRAISGLFAPVVDACCRGRVLDVNKIHFILARVADKNLLVGTIDDFIASHESRLGFYGRDYRATMAKRRLDSLEISYIKDMLQKVLPSDLRQELVDGLFAKHVSADEADFAAGLYLNAEQLKEMREEGMFLSIHGRSHQWLSTLTAEAQALEIGESISFLESLGAPRSEISISYPFGDFNNDTLSIVGQYGIRLGFTVEVSLAYASKHDLLTLPRLDTNDLPKDRYFPVRAPAGSIIKGK